MTDQRSSVRLRVLDAGSLEHMDPTRFGLTSDEVQTDRLSVAAYLIEHPRGRLMWDTGAIADRDWSPDPARTPVRASVALPDGSARDLLLVRGIGDQLAEMGIELSSIDYLALSHHHFDHTANVDLFGDATWLVRRAGYEAMSNPRPPRLTRPADLAALLSMSRQLIDTEAVDLFGDGTVVLHSAAGHTPGHQVLLVRLAHTGPVLLCGDLYHYPQERTLDRVPTFESDAAATRSARRDVEALIADTGADLWIGHDAIADATIRKAPAAYE